MGPMGPQTDVMRKWPRQVLLTGLLACLPQVAAANPPDASKGLGNVSPKQIIVKKTTRIPWKGEPRAYYAGMHWSPDGKHILVSEKRDTRPPGARGWDRVWVLDVATGKSRVVIDDGAIYRPVWSPNGRSIAYQNHANEIVVLDCNVENIVTAQTLRRRIIGKRDDSSYIRWGLDGHRLWVWTARTKVGEIDQLPLEAKEKRKRRSSIRIKARKDGVYARIGREKRLIGPCGRDPVVEGEMVTYHVLRDGHKSFIECGVDGSAKEGARKGRTRGSGGSTRYSPDGFLSARPIAEATHDVEPTIFAVGFTNVCTGEWFWLNPDNRLKPRSLAWAPDGCRIAVIDDDIYLLDLEVKQ